MRFFKGSRFAAALVALSSVAAVVPAAHAQIELSGGTLYNSDAAGNTNGGFWNTLGPEGGFAFNLYFFTGPTSSPTFLNTGDATATLDPNFLMTPGTYTVNFAGTTSPSQFFGINLYFDNLNTGNNNRISALTQAGVGGFSVIPTSSSTRSNETGIVPGSGTLSYTNGNGTTVTLTGFEIISADETSVDLVSPFNNVPDGSSDNFGTLTFLVTGAGANAAPEPATWTLLATGLLLGAVRVAARKRRSH